MPFPSLRNSILNKISETDSAAHDWYRFVLSFPPHLVREYLQRFELTTSDTVLDPFCGTGTTLVECKKQGIPSIGIEAHPMAHFASRVKTNWHVDFRGLKEHAENIAEKTKVRLREDGFPEEESILFSPQDDLRQAPTGNLLTLAEESFKIILTNSISPIPLHKTLVLLETIHEGRDDRFYDHELLALAKALVSSISNLHFGPEVGIGKLKQNARVTDSWLECTRLMARDMEKLQDQRDVPVVVYKADSRQLLYLLQTNTVKAVITSPPYPNEKDYTRTTRLESVILGFIRNKHELKELKRYLLRSNTRNVYKLDDDDQWIASHEQIQRLAETIEQRRIELGKTSGFERLYHRVTKLYFGGMARHFGQLRSALRPGSYLAYVVGDQASYLRVMIRTGQLLADVARSLGYEVVDIDLFRTRLATATREQLREEVVILRWPGQSTRIAESSFKYNTRKLGMTKEPPSKSSLNRYSQIIEKIFLSHYKKGMVEVTFIRDEIVKVAKTLKIDLPKNLGDIIYTFRSRASLPESIISTAPRGKHWIIRSSGRSKYRFCLTEEQNIVPDAILAETKIPDSTPGLISMYALDDEQALLARLRYNRLIDIFTGITCCSLQSHLRTAVTGIGQIETDEIYIGVDKKGVHYVFPVQAKGGRDKINVVQIEQDFAMCSAKFSSLVCRAIGAQFMADDLIALFEFESTPEGTKKVAERHYRLVPPDEVTPDLLRQYRERLTET